MARATSGALFPIHEIVRVFRRGARCPSPHCARRASPPNPRRCRATALWFAFPTRWRAHPQRAPSRKSCATTSTNPSFARSPTRFCFTIRPRFRPTANVSLLPVGATRMRAFTTRRRKTRSLAPVHQLRASRRARAVRFGSTTKLCWSKVWRRKCAVCIGCPPTPRRIRRAPWLHRTSLSAAAARPMRWAKTASCFRPKPAPTRRPISTSWRATVRVCALCPRRLARAARRFRPTAKRSLMTRRRAANTRCGLCRCCASKIALRCANACRDFNCAPMPRPNTTGRASH